MDALYLDNAATTRVHPKALAAMMPFLEGNFHNPSSVYGPARVVRQAIDEARSQIAGHINARPEEIFFTGSGTEADNWALHGAVAASPAKRHIITTAIEHHGVLYACRALEKRGFDVTYLPVDADGLVNPADLADALRPDTAVVSVIMANNEVGTIQPLAEIGALTRKNNTPLHTDAVQSVGHIPVDVDALDIDMLALSAHKFYGPNGIGALYVRKGTPLAPLLHGGAQERGRRAGTENVAGIVGMAAALNVAVAEMPREQPRVTALRDRLMAEILEKIPHTKPNGHPTRRLPGNVNISFRFIEGESLLLHLDMQKCYASTGSACSSGALEPSHVLMAMGLPHGLANGALRFSFGRDNTEADIDRLMAILVPSVERLRAMSPLYDDFVKKGEK
ncbi:MAG: cysteine desulfurase NifS [Defluviitaleaceae bacterium]|nr:cysteine desulfurase NifS [Defluviitaleaceae bacterium]MCL2239430.1 cysteine desulfurase NifS [Defluviitaleaceae bacterium]